MSLTDIKNSVGKTVETVVQQNLGLSKAIEVTDQVSTYENVAVLDAVASIPLSESSYKKDISYQILMEPLNETVGEEGIVSNILEFIRVSTQSFLSDRLENLNLLSGLSQNPDSINNDTFSTPIESLGKSNTTVALNVTSEQATGNVFINPKGNYNVVSNALNLISDSHAYLKAPHIDQHTQNYNVQSNNSFSLLTKLILNKSDAIFNDIDNWTQRSVDSTVVNTNTFSSTSKYVKQA